MLFTIQAGYVVHAPEPVYSVCGNIESNYEERTCSLLKHALLPQCSNDRKCFNLDSSCWNYTYDEEYSGIQSSCQQSNADALCQCHVDGSGSCQFGRISQPPPSNNKPAVTVWYNNQVS